MKKKWGRRRREICTHTHEHKRERYFYQRHLMFVSYKATHQMILIEKEKSATCELEFYQPTPMPQWEGQSSFAFQPKK